MAGPGLGKLTSSIEELSLKKQLPLREQERKPLLQYSSQQSSLLAQQYHSPLNRPVQLFNQSDIVALRNAANDTGSPYPYGGTSSVCMLPSDKPPARKESPVSGRRFSHGHHSPGGHSPQSQSESHQSLERRPSPTKTSDPYSRPLSSKDLASISAQYQKSLRRLPGGVTVRTVASPDSANRHAALQTNSFMLPHSVLRSDKHSLTPQTTQRVSKKSDRSSSSNNKTLSDAATSTSSVSELAASVNGARSRASTPTNPNPASVGKEACKALIEIGSRVSQAADRVATGKSDEVASTSSTSLCSQSPSACASRPPTGLGRPIITVHRPGSRGSTRGSVSSTQNDTPSKVRNPNYTPTKPYHQVQEPGMESYSPSPPPSPPPGGAGSPTRSDKSRQSIQFYRKGSKSQEQIHEHGVRLKGDGAPSRASQGGESDHKLLQSASGTSEAYEGEGSENGTPSGERLPGDGEASAEDWDTEDADDVSDHGDDIDDLEGDFTDTDNDSDSYSITSSLSKPSLASHSRLGRQSATPCRPVSTPSDRRQLRSRSASSDVPIHSPLTPSLFSNIPPTINFVAEGEKVEKLPWEIRKLLKWRLSPITPNVVKALLSRIGFRITKRNHDWLGCFGKHMKSQAFKSIRDYQKLNHFPGSFQLGRKDRLWRNLSKMQVHFGKKEYGFFPQTFVLPYDLKLLKRAWEDGGCKQKWIIKPPASARGIGIKVIHKWTQIPRKRPVIVQRYLARPFLINDSKFDMRVYVYVSSCDPLRIYVYEDGLARFASSKYSSSMKNLSNKFMHLTNYSINKKNDEYQSNSDETVCQGHKWSLKALWSYLRKQGVNSGAVWDSVKDLIVKTVICAESPMNSMIKANVRSRYSVHELFGFDILLDENLRPWILEVNISPSLHSNSQLDVNIKGNMVKDMFNIAGFRIPSKQDVTPSGSSSTTDLSSYIPSNDYCMDKRQFCGQLAPDERAKHAYYCQRHMDEHALQTILDTLTPDDIRILTESIDEDSRKGGFQRVFPTPSTHQYLRFFEQARYYNLLLDCWVQRYNRLEARGIAMLQSFCREGIHFDLATDNPSHQWSPPSASVLTFREGRMTSAPANKPPKETDADVKARILQQHFSGPSQFSRVSSMRRSKASLSGGGGVTRPVPSPSPVIEPSPSGKPPRPPGSITENHR